jgi:hypothetical protein
MPAPLEVVRALLLGLPLWIAGVHFFDGVHWVLHRMMRSRWGLLRVLSRPHVMHHRWLDPSLSTRWEYQHRNLWGHIVLEYVTQLVFSALLLLVLPTGVVAACVLYQTLLFAYILSERGLDVNHRAIEMLDAYRPSFLAMPAYHALHHVYPDAYFSAYSKLVDYVIGGGVYLRGRRIAMLGADSAFGRALRERLQAESTDSIRELEGPDSTVLEEIDVLVLCDPDLDRLEAVERFIRATRQRQLPPEVWAVQREAADGLARHYYRDLRVTYRALHVAPDALDDPTRARRAARTALFCIRPAPGARARGLSPFRYRAAARQGTRGRRGGRIGCS